MNPEYSVNFCLNPEYLDSRVLFKILRVCVHFGVFLEYCILNTLLKWVWILHAILGLYPHLIKSQLDLHFLFLIMVWGIIVTLYISLLQCREEWLIDSVTLVLWKNWSIGKIDSVHSCKVRFPWNAMSNYGVYSSRIQ